MTKDSSDSPYRTAHHQPSHPPKPHKPQKAHASDGAHARHARSTSGGRRRRKPGKAKGHRPHVSHASHASHGAHASHSAHTIHTSHPTTRSAQQTTRAWLLTEYGPICAYCGEKYTARKLTLDHVAPRRGQTAYDRRDNLVLACRPCNAAKRDQSPLAYLLGLRSRAVNLVKFGAHLSQGLLEMARALVPSNSVPSSGRANIDYSKWGPIESDDDSPYRR